MVNINYVKIFLKSCTHPPSPVDFVDPASGILLQAKEGEDVALSPSLQGRALKNCTACNFSKGASLQGREGLG
jgi:hypothetical protein